MGSTMSSIAQAPIPPAPRRGTSERAAARTQPIVGRSAVLALIEERIRAAADGRGSLVAVTGMPGIGKSTLLDAASEGADARVCAARCDELAQRPFGVVLEALGGLVDPVGDGSATELALVEALERACASGPVILALDDLHLADEATFALLLRLCDRLPGWPLVVLTALRTPVRGVPLARVLARGERRGVLAELGLGPLGADTALELAQRVTGGPVLPDLARRLRSADGHPLLILTLLASPARELPVGEDLDSRSARSILRAVELHELSTATRELLETASVLGGSFSVRELGRVSPVRPEDLRASLRVAVDAGILVDARERLAFRHPVVREAVYVGLTHAFRAELHRAAAQGLDADGASAVTVADHLTRAALSRADLDLVLGVATRVGATVPAKAPRLWELAAQLVDEEHPRRGEVQAGLALAWLGAGRPDLAQRAARDALAAPVPRGLVGALSLCAATALCVQGRWHEAQAVCEQAALRTELTPAEKAEQVAVAALASTMTDDRLVAARTIQRADQLSRIARSRQAQRDVNVANGNLAYRRGRLVEAERLLARAARVAPPGERDECLPAPGLRAAVLCDLDRTAEAEAVLAAPAAGTTSWASRMSLAAAAAALALDTGDLGRAVAALDACLSLETDGLPASPVQLAQRAAAAMHQQGFRAAERWLGRISPDLGPFSPALGMSWLPRVMAAVRVSHGDLMGAHDQLWRGWQWGEAAGAVPDLLRIATPLVEVADRSGRVDHAAAATARLDEVCRGNPGIPSLDAAMLFAHAVLTRDADVLVAAADRSLDSPRLLDAADLVSMAAARLVELGEEEVAVTLAGRAMASYTRAGATYDARRLRGWLRGAGLAVPGPRRPARGRDALTRTELIVLGHLERGLSNSDIALQMVISRRTVESHVSRILAKLGARTRAELIARAEPGQRTEDPPVPTRDPHGEDGLRT